MSEKTKIPVIDRDKCTGCGTCLALCPDVFEIDNDGKAIVKNAKACENCDCQAAIESCPVEAIAWQ